MLGAFKVGSSPSPVVLTKATATVVASPLLDWIVNVPEVNEASTCGTLESIRDSNLCKIALKVFRPAPALTVTLLTTPFTVIL